MGKIAFLYPGQGSQKVGMGKELAQTDLPLFKQFVVKADQVSGERISRFSLLGPQETLSQTHIAQPALFTYSLALTEYARRLGLTPQMIAGHSLGEYTAAVAAGAISFAEALQLVCERGRLMKQEQERCSGAMAVVIGLAKETLEELCQTITQRDLVQVTNWNAPTQLVVSGTEKGVQRLIAAVHLQGQGRAMRLPVGGAFHSSLMANVRESLRAQTQALQWQDAAIPLVGNVSGQIIARGEEIRQELIEQITHPVQWVPCMETLLAEGCDTFIELGPGQVLTRLVRLFAPHVTAIAIETPEHLMTFVKARATEVPSVSLSVA